GEWKSIDAALDQRVADQFHALFVFDFEVVVDNIDDLIPNQIAIQSRHQYRARLSGNYDSRRSIGQWNRADWWRNGCRGRRYDWLTGRAEMTEPTAAGQPGRQRKQCNDGERSAHEIVLRSLLHHGDTEI